MADTSPTTPSHPAVIEHEFLSDMLGSDYYPQHLVKKGQALLLTLAARLEREKPVGAAAYKLTHATTEAFNALQDEFFEEDSELETVARENIAGDIDFLLTTYGYELDLEEAIAPRDW